MNNKIISIFLLIVALFSFNFEYILGLRVCAVLMWVSNITYAFKNSYKNICFLLFNITFLVFLLGIPLIQLLTPRAIWAYTSLNDFSESTLIHIYFTLFLGLFCIYIFYDYFQNSNNNTATVEVDYNSFNALRNLSKKLSYFFLLFAAIGNIEKSIFVYTIGYINYYTDFVTTLPGIFIKLAALYNLSFFLFLATMPTKKEAKVPIILYLLLGVSSLGYGQRNGMMLNFVMMALYFSFRQHLKIYGNDEQWITRRIKTIVVVGMPFLLIFLGAFNSMRSKETYDFSQGFISNIQSFFYQQGGSISIIGYEYDLHDQLPQKWYSFGPIIERFTNISFFKSLDLFTTYSVKSSELAMNGHNFGETITYLHNQDLYMHGGGLGSCYLAEIYSDFEYFGIILISMLYGWIFSKARFVIGKSIWSFYCLLIILERIFYSPRADALGFITELTSLPFIVFTFLMYQYYKKTRSI